MKIYLWEKVKGKIKRADEKFQGGNYLFAASLCCEEDSWTIIYPIIVWHRLLFRILNGGQIYLLNRRISLPPFLSFFSPFLSFFNFFFKYYSLFGGQTFKNTFLALLLSFNTVYLLFISTNHRNESNTLKKKIN